MLGFENWAVIALGGIPNKVQVGDRGVDGRIFPVGTKPADKDSMFSDDWFPIQVKQMDKVGHPDIDAFQAITPAVGEITHLGGRILDAKGDPIRNALVEIWQVDNNAIYFHTQGGSREKRDSNFQGFGRFMTGGSGEYYFRTIKPVPYPGRTPHIHFAVKIKGREKFTTQCYVKGHPKNESDGVLRGIRDAKQKASVLVDFAPVKGSKIGELATKFDIVMGFTPEV